MEEKLKTIPTNEDLQVLNPDGIEIDMTLVEQFINEEGDEFVQSTLNEDSLEVLCEEGEIENA
jgi:hypothetical protein|nr:MAG TPA: hypothetical protein [Caudoviricetes sp.]